MTILPPLSAGLTTKSFIALIFPSGVGCLYNLVMSVSTLLKYFVRGLNVYSGGCQWDFTLKRGIVFSFWCLK